jgi:predicted nucleic acid-binding protein
MAIVSDSSPLIALEQIGQLNLLRQLFQTLLIPEAVASETRHSVGPRSWIEQRALSRPLLVETLSPALGPGEREAVSLGAEMQAEAVLLDDEAARRIAARLGLPVLGTAGVLLLAKQRNLIPAVKPHLDALVATRFFLGPQLYELILSRAGEL